MTIQLSTKAAGISTVSIHRIDAASKLFIDIILSDGSALTMRYADAIGLRNALTRAIREAEMLTPNETARYVPVGIALDCASEARGDETSDDALPTETVDREAIRAAAFEEAAQIAENLYDSRSMMPLIIVGTTNAAAEIRAHATKKASEI